PHVGGGGVDHLARQGAGGGDVQRRRQIEAVRRDQTGAAALRPGLVAVEQIAAQREGQSGLMRRLALDALQPPVARRQARRKASPAPKRACSGTPSAPGTTSSWPALPVKPLTSAQTAMRPSSAAPAATMRTGRAVSAAAINSSD